MGEIESLLISFFRLFAAFGPGLDANEVTTFSSTLSLFFSLHLSPRANHPSGDTVSGGSGDKQRMFPRMSSRSNNRHVPIMRYARWEGNRTGAECDGGPSLFGRLFDGGDGPSQIGVRLIQVMPGC